MNGRVYDPTIGRFLSADPILQTTQLSQALNPFSYVMNNPLALVDPTGYSWLSKLFHNIGSFLKKWGSLIIAVVAAICGMPFLLGALLSSAYSWAVNGGTFSNFLVGFAIGLAAGLIAGPISGQLARAMGIAEKSLWQMVFRGALSGGIAAGISSAAMGQSFWSGVLGGALAGGVAAFAVGYYRQNLLSRLMDKGTVTCSNCSGAAQDGLKAYALSPEGQKFFQDLEKSSQGLDITQAPEANKAGEFLRADQNENGRSSLKLPADLDVYRAQPGVPVSDALASATFSNLIAHEVAHWYPAGIYKWVPQEDGFGSALDRKPAEIFASGVENGFRFWSGQPLRATYGPWTVPQASCLQCIH